MPAIAVPALQQRIAAGRLDPLYLIVGDDVRLAEALVEAIEHTVDEADRPFAVRRVYANEENGGGAPIDIAAAARDVPMLGDRRIVVVLRAEKFLKPKRAAKAEAPDEGDDGAGGEESEDLGDVLTAASRTTRNRLVDLDHARLRRHGDRSVPPVHEEIARTGAGGRSAWHGAQGRPQSHRLRPRRSAAPGAGDSPPGRSCRTIDPIGLTALVVAAAEGDINRLRDDIGKLSVLFAGDRKQLTADDVEAVASGDGVVDDWGVVNAIGEGNVARALVEVGRRIDRGASPHAIVGQLRWWVSTRLVEGAPERAKPAIDAILRTDRALKSSGGEERVLLERLVVELTGKPLPASRGWARPSR